MAQKNATPNKEQQTVIKAVGLNPLMWSVLKDLPNSLIIILIIIHRIEKTVKLISKNKENYL